MAGDLLVSLVLILVAGVGASWLAWRLELPSILLLLVTGFLIGPVAGWLHPDQLFGDLLLPVVSFSVAVILFEGGLTLQTIELEEVGSVVRNLVTVGVLVTWAVTTAGAYLLLDLGLNLSLLLGAILVVTGPTVIIPLLRHLRPKANVSTTLKWEGILIDPIGVILSVGVFRAILAGGLTASGFALVYTIAKALAIGVVFGIGGAILTYVALKRNWVPDVLHSPMTLAVVGVVFVSAETLQPEAGLVAATVMGAVLANREDFAKRHIMEFKETLRTLLIGFLFIVLAARLDLSDLSVVGPSSLVFLAVLFFLARPLAVWVSTIGSDLDWRERTFLTTMAPRGIVAAAIASVFALQLVERGYPGADRLVAITFLVIVATVGVYGFVAGPIGRRLGVAEPNPQGVLIVGAQRWAREMATTLQGLGLRILLVDTNRHNLRAARSKGLDTHAGNSLDRGMLDDVDFAGLGHLLAVTPNDEVNSLTVLHFQEIFERSNTYQLTASEAEERDAHVPLKLRGRVLFDETVTGEGLRDLVREGWTFHAREVEESEELEGFGTGPYPLFVYTADGRLRPITSDNTPTPEAGDRVIELRSPDDQ
ncbi:hypothetical protein BRD56_08855 [Thermoplasmatales archaeon SW_10_69_26]|nr:MAG: hypothetical protein BRD56_08855 [Thermoplasmatales archaeon SW_10_69_26]